MKKKDIKFSTRMAAEDRTTIKELAKQAFWSDLASVATVDGNDAKLMQGKKILIVDDVISTGESLSALEVLIEKAGGIVCGRMAILAEGDAQEREDLIYLEKLPLFHPDGTPME